MSTPGNSTWGKFSQNRGPGKQKPCNLWRQGHCRFGANCKFQHADKDKGIFAKNENKPQAAVEEGSSAGLNRCVQATGSGTIASPTNGSTLESGWRKQESPTSNRQTGTHIFNTFNVPEKRTVCRDWKAGNCTRGDRCRFRHDDGGLQMTGISDGECLVNHSTRNSGARALLYQAENAEERDKLHEETIRLEEEEQKKEAEKLTAEHPAIEREEQMRQKEARRFEEQQRIKERKEREQAARNAREEQRRREEAQKAEEERRKREEKLAREKAAREAREEAVRMHQVEVEATRRREAAIVEQYVVLDSSLVTCGAGLDIRHIVTGFELCRITIKNLPKNARRDEIADIFTQQGVSSSEFFILQVKEVGNNKLEGIVLANAEHGQAIAAGLEGIEFRDEVLSFDVSDNASWNSMGVMNRTAPFIIISWRIPVETFIATYNTAEEAREQVRKLDSKTWRGHLIRATLDDHPRRTGPFGYMDADLHSTAVKFTGFPFSAQLQYEFSEFAGTYNMRALRSIPYDHEDTLASIRRHLTFNGGVQMHTFEVMTPNATAGEFKIKVQFSDWEDVKGAHKSFDKKKMGTSPYLRAWHPMPLQYSIKIPSQQYHAQKKQWDALSEKKPGSDAHVHARIGDRGDVFIRVLGGDKKAAGSLKVRVENMVAGETLDANYWHPSFLSFGGSKRFFDRVNQTSGVYVRSDFKTRSLKVYGEPEKVEEARQVIKAEVERLEQMETTRVLDGGSVRFFMRGGLGKLQELLGEENVNLNLASRPCRITIKGGEEARHHLQRLIEESHAAMSLGAALPDVVERETCPICYDDVSHPEQLGCGHTYCSGCLKHFLTSAADTKAFPLVCMGNDATCNVPVSIPLIRRFLPAQTFQHLVEVAFNCHLDKHPKDLKYCTTPDCKQIYRRCKEKALLRCPSCFSTICPACDEEAHEGMTCEERRLHSDPAEQERLNDQLAAANGYKKCPQCKVWIEKTEGCNHMSCKCGAHICWRCMGIFGAGDIYQHMNAAHGNIYDEVPAGVHVGGAANNNFMAEQADVLAQIERERVARVRREAEVVRLRREAEAQAEATRIRLLRRTTVTPVATPAAAPRNNVGYAVPTYMPEAEQLRRRQEAAELRRRANEENDRIYRRRVLDEQAEAHRQEQAALNRARQQEESGGWCVVM